MKYFAVIYFLLNIILFSTVNSIFAQQRQKVLIDCDLGGDIDDAFALALLLASPEVEILGIVLDHGQTDKRAQVACKLLNQAGMGNIPVIKGRQTPTVIGKDTGAAIYNDQFYWAEGFERVKPLDKSADDFIIETLRRFPNEVVLFTLAPLPNIADVIKKDPSALKLAKHIYSMLGSYYIGYDGNPRPDAEWNVFADISSAKEFIAQGLGVTYAGLDITTSVRLDKEEIDRLEKRNSPLTNALCSLYSLWGTEKATLFDAVAVSMLLWPDLFTTKPAKIRVTDDGHTVMEENKKSDSQVGISINKDEFIKRMITRLLRQNLNEN